MLRAIHLKTAGLSTEWASDMAIAAVSAVTGVAKVAAVKSAGIVSVMFDDRYTNAEKILLAVRGAGFDARLLRPGS